MSVCLQKDQSGQYSGGTVWRCSSCLFSQSSLFSDYRIQSNANNEISMEIPTEPLCQALRSAQASADVVVKLAKKNDRAVLTFDVQAVVSD